jgi:hypothetical protein
MSSDGALPLQDLSVQDLASQSQAAVPSAAVSSAAVSPAVVQPQSAREALQELERLLALERAALVRLDRDAIEAFAQRKLELDAALKEHAARVPLCALDKELLVSVREAALSNQLLLAHARSCVQGVLSLLAPVNAPGYTASGHAPAASANPPPLALNFRR